MRSVQQIKAGISDAGALNGEECQLAFGVQTPVDIIENQIIMLNCGLTLSHLK